MERLTKDNPQENWETMMNYVFSRDGWAHIRHDGESEDVPLTSWAKAQCIKRGCDEFPGETAKETDETLCDCLMDGEGCPVALAYCFACQAAILRSRLMAIEDILGDEYDLDHLRELAQDERAGRRVVLPPCKLTDAIGKLFPKGDVIGLECELSDGCLHRVWEGEAWKLPDKYRDYELVRFGGFFPNVWQTAIGVVVQPPEPKEALRARQGADVPTLNTGEIGGGDEPMQ